MLSKLVLYETYNIKVYDYDKKILFNMVAGRGNTLKLP